jgi:hypothetical protein
MVDVPVEDKDSLHPMGLNRMGGGHRHVVEQAEAHRPIAFRVVAGRTQATEGEAPIRQQPLHSDHRAAGRMQRRLPGPGARDGIEVDDPAAAPGELLDRIHVAHLMDAVEQLALHRRRLDQLHREPVAIRHRFLDRGQPTRVLGVAARVVLE